MDPRTIKFLHHTAIQQETEIHKHGGKKSEASTALITALFYSKFINKQCRNVWVSCSISKHPSVTSNFFPSYATAQYMQLRRKGNAVRAGEHKLLSTAQQHRARCQSLSPLGTGLPGSD